MVVQGCGSLAYAGVLDAGRLVPVILGQQDGERGQAYVLYQLVWCGASCQDVLWQVDLHNVLEVRLQLLLHFDGPIEIPIFDFAQRCLPRLIITLNSSDFILSEEVRHLYLAHFLVVGRASFLVILSFIELIKHGKKYNEPHGQEGHNNEQPNETDQEDLGHVGVLPLEQIPNFLKEIAYYLKPL